VYRIGGSFILWSTRGIPPSSFLVPHFQFEKKLDTG